MDLKSGSNGVSLTGLHSMYTDFDRWMVAFNQKYRRRPSQNPVKTLAASSYDHTSCVDEQFMRPFVGNIRNQNGQSKLTSAVPDAEYFANYNHYLLLRLYNDRRRQCEFNDFRSKL